MSFLRVFVLLLVASAFLGTFFIFDLYVTKNSEELINTVVRNEAAAFQQGNLLKSITKLQAVVETSESLRGVAAYDRSLDSSFSYPLILVGSMPDLGVIQSADQFYRTGLFSRVYMHTLPYQRDKVIVFSFQPNFVLVVFILFATLLLAFSGAVLWLGQRMESLRGEERNAALRAISAQVSHDIRSPLGALKVLASVMKGEAQHLSMMKDIIVRIESIVGDLNAKSKKQDPSDRRSSFEAGHVISSVVREKSLEHPQHTVRVDGTDSIEIEGSVESLERVLSNLINNSVEASSPDQTIVVSYRRVAHTCVIEVIDKGSGIPTEVVRRLFQRGSSFGKSGGSGLGLYHAKGAIESMGGSISLESQSGEGTKVSIRLPVLIH